MKKIFSKTIKFGRYTISIFSNEIVLVRIGKKKIFIKTIRLKLPSFKIPELRVPKLKTAKVKPSRFRVPTINILYHKKAHPVKKKLVLALGAAMVLIIFIFSLYPGKEKEPTVRDDEEIKNKLLLSSKTDYSSPVKYRKLIIHEHRVAKGENLNKIAKKYGVSVDTICGTNNLRSYHIIREGTILKIPNKDGILYRMRKGNKIVDVAKLYKVSLKKIIDENNLKNPDFISSNAILFIPDAKPRNIFSGFLWPTFTRRITCGYGWRRNPFDRRFREFHSGLDIRCRYQWVRASKYGKVTYTGWLGGYGKTIVIAHPGGWKTLYAHLSRIIVRRGQYVKQGQSIAKSGNTGRSTGAHLHFEILKNGSHRNPYRYLRRKKRY